MGQHGGQGRSIPRQYLPGTPPTAPGEAGSSPFYGPQERPATGEECHSAYAAAILKPTQVSIALIYAQISDQEVLRDYKSISPPGAVIAGPAALDLRSGVLPDEAVRWLKANFFKTELELGHCLRLPAEEPCECDLYLTCAKSVTISEYIPGLRGQARGRAAARPGRRRTRLDP